MHAAPPATEPAPRLEDCYFYHSMELPGIGEVHGEWDLRGGVDAYLGGVALGGKRVLEMGTASGFLCFEMEQRGAEVIAFDLDDSEDWDVVPFAGQDDRALVAVRKDHIRRLNASFRLGHRALGSRARAVHGSVYRVPEALGPVDVVTYGSILMHLRDPFLALQQGTRLARETVVVTELLGRVAPPGWPAPLAALLPDALTRPAMRFLPDPRTGEPRESWWRLGPELVQRFVGVLGFGQTRVVRHTQLLHGRPVRMFTVVGTRTAGRAVGTGG